MTLDQAVTALIYLATTFVLIVAGKWIYGFLNRRIDVQSELVEKDNLAFSLSYLGYFLGLVIALGGVLNNEATYWLTDVVDILFYGIFTVLLMSISIIINDKIILAKFDNRREIIDDQNPGAGIIEGANYVAVGMILFGAMSGSGDLVTALVFWIIGQAALIASGVIYNLILPFDLHGEIERDNSAVGVAFAGVLIAIGNILRVALSGDFVSWSSNLMTFMTMVAFGFLMLPIVRMIADRILLPGRRLTDELVNQNKPNVGAGAIEAASYVAASFLLVWVI